MGISIDLWTAGTPRCGATLRVEGDGSFWSRPFVVIWSATGGLGVVNALANVLKEEVGAERPLCYCLLIWLFTSVNGDQQPCGPARLPGNRLPYALCWLVVLARVGTSLAVPGCGERLACGGIPRYATTPKAAAGAFRVRTGALTTRGGLREGSDENFFGNSESGEGRVWALVGSSNQAVGTEKPRLR